MTQKEVESLHYPQPLCPAVKPKELSLTICISHYISMSHSPVNSCNLTVTFGSILSQDKYHCLREAFVPHPTEDIFLSIRVKAFGILGQELSQLDPDQPYLCMGEIHVQHPNNRRLWTLFPYAIVPCTQMINIITITGRFGTEYRTQGVSKSKNSSYLKDKIAVPAHISELNPNNPQDPCNRTWIPLTAWDKIADLISTKAHKGNLSSVSGSLTFRSKLVDNGSTPDGVGEEVIYSEIEVTRIQLLHSPSPAPQS